jgi:hypothetical protein
MKIVIYRTKPFQLGLEKNFSLEEFINFNLYGKAVRILAQKTLELIMAQKNYVLLCLFVVSFFNTVYAEGTGKPKQVTIGQYLAIRLEEVGISDYFAIPGDYNLIEPSAKVILSRAKCGEWCREIW